MVPGAPWHPDCWHHNVGLCARPQGKIDAWSMDLTFRFETEIFILTYYYMYIIFPSYTPLNILIYSYIYIYIYIYIYLFLYILLKNKYSYISLCILIYPYVFLYILQYCIFYEILIYSDIYTYIINIFLHIIILTTCAPCFAATLQCLSSCLSMLHVVWIATLPRKDQRRERVRKKKTQMREKVGKWQFIPFFQWFVAPEGRKVGSLKRRVRSHLARWEMKNCTPL